MTNDERKSYREQAQEYRSSPHPEDKILVETIDDYENALDSASLKHEKLKSVVRQAIQLLEEGLE